MSFTERFIIQDRGGSDTGGGSEPADVGERAQTGYEAVNWQNFGRRLTAEEFAGIARRIAGLHFAKEAFQSDPIAMQALYAAEALQREVDILSKDSPFPPQEC